MSWTLFILLWFTSGTICTIVRICAFYRNKKVKEQCTSRTEAIVIDIVISESTRTSRNGFERTVYFYFPVIEFCANGRVMREKLCIGYSYKKYKVGETITIFYNPNKPTEYFIEGDKSKKFIGTVCIIVGVAHLFFGFLSYAVLFMS
jgi:hypothetical protein